VLPSLKEGFYRLTTRIIAAAIIGESDGGLHSSVRETHFQVRAGEFIPLTVDEWLELSDASLAIDG
jgi:hypothetical protein